MRKVFFLFLLLSIGVILGLFLSDKIPQRQVWTKDGVARLNICHFYQEPKCVDWTVQTDGLFKFSNCQGWSCYRESK